MNVILSEINKLAFIISPIFYKILAMSWSALIIIGIIQVINNCFKKKIPFLLKKSIIFLAILVMIVPLRFESKYSLNTGALGSFETVSYRNQYDEAEYKLFIAQQQETTDELTETDIEIMENNVKRYFKLSLLFDIILPVSWLIGIIVHAFIRISSAYKFDRNIRRNTLPVSEKISNCFEKNKRLFGIKQNVKLVVQNQVNYPAVTGVFRPVVILPEYTDDCDDETLNYIMLHELAHIKQGDLFINSILFVQNIVYWYWSNIFTAIREEMEKLNDEYVIKYLDNEQRKNYSKSLVLVLARCNNIQINPKLLGMTDNKKNIKNRIELIKNDKNIKRFGTIGCIVIMVLVSFMAFTKDSNRNDITNTISSYRKIDFITISRTDREYQFVYSTDDEYGSQSVEKFYDGLTKSNQRSLNNEDSESVYYDYYYMYDENYVINIYLKEKQPDGNNKLVQFRINENDYIISTIDNKIYQANNYLKALLSELNAVVLSDNITQKICDKYSREIELIETKHGFEITELDGFTLGVIKTEAALNLNDKNYQFSEMMTEFAYAIANEGYTDDEIIYLE